MLLTTAQQLIDSFFLTGEIGTPMVVATAREQTNSSNVTMLTVPPGQVFLITHVVQQAENSAHLTAAVTSPNLGDLASISLHDSAGTSQSLIAFMVFERFANTTGQSSSPTFRSSSPSNTVSWRPKYAIPIPEGWSVQCPSSGGELGNYAAVYGYLVDRASARTLGYTVSNSVTDADRNYGVFASNTTASITGRTGKSIRVLDVYVRSQGEVAATKNELVIGQHGGAEMFVLGNSNPMETLDLQFSPESWFVKAGTDLDVTIGDTGTFSVVITYEYVNSDEVPQNVWWTCVRPGLPTPGTGVEGLLNTFTADSTVATLYYPGLDTTKTSPLKGYQHILRGYAASVQKGGTATSADTDDTDQLLFTISTGASAGAVTYTFGTMTGTGVQLAPVLAAPTQNQTVAIAVSDICIAGKQDTGSLWIDSLGLGANSLTTPTGDLDIQTWAVSMWGMTIPNRFTDPSNRGS